MKRIFVLIVMLLAMVPSIKADFLGIKKSSETIAFFIRPPLDSLYGIQRKPDSVHIFTYLDNAAAAAYQVRSTTFPFSDISIDTLDHFTDTMYIFADAIADIDGAGCNCVLSINVQMYYDKTPTHTFMHVQIVNDSLSAALDDATTALADVVNIDAWAPILDNDSLIIDQSSLEDMTVAVVTTVTNDVSLANSTHGAIADSVWDEILTGATHNTNNSSGKILRQIKGGFVIHDGTSDNVPANGANAFSLETGGGSPTTSTVNDFYNHQILNIVEGTGIGQAVIISDYNGTNQVATVTPAFLTTPDATSVYEITVGLVHAETQGGGYALGAVWVSPNGAAGTQLFVNGTIDNPIDDGSFADAKTVADALNMTIFRIQTGSNITLATTYNMYSFEGTEWTLALGGQDVASSTFRGASVTGIATGANVIEFFDCKFGAVQLPASDFFNCGFGLSLAATDSLLATGTGQYIFRSCYSLVSGPLTPVFAMGDAVANTKFGFRNYDGGMELSEINSTGNDSISIEGFGNLVLNATDIGGELVLRGNWTIDSTAGGSLVNLTRDAALSGAYIADVTWDEDSTGHYTSPQMAFVSAQTAASAGVSDAEMAAIMDSMSNRGIVQYDSSQATLQLTSLVLSNSAGIAFSITGGSNNPAMRATGHGTAPGVQWIGGDGGAGGVGADFIGGATGQAGLRARATASSGGSGFLGIGNLAGHGMNLDGGTTGNGLDATGGLTSGHGIAGTSQDVGAGMHLSTSDPTFDAAAPSSALRLSGGTQGIGMFVTGGSDSGNAAVFDNSSEMPAFAISNTSYQTSDPNGAQNAHGLSIEGGPGIHIRGFENTDANAAMFTGSQNGGNGIVVDGGTAGDAIQIIGGANSGNGIRITGPDTGIFINTTRKDIVSDIEGTIDSVNVFAADKGVIADSVDADLTADHGAGAWTSAGGGSGANAVVIRAVDTTGTADTISFAEITVRTLTGGIQGSAQKTTSEGVTNWSLDSDDYVIQATKPGYSWLPDTITVSGVDTFAINGNDNPAGSPPSGDSISTVTVNVVSSAGSALKGIWVTANLAKSFVVRWDGVVVYNVQQRKRTDSNGQVTFFCLYSTAMDPDTKWIFATEGPGRLKRAQTIPSQSTTTIDFGY